MYKTLTELVSIRKHSMRCI